MKVMQWSKYKGKSGGSAVVEQKSRKYKMETKENKKS